MLLDYLLKKGIHSYMHVYPFRIFCVRFNLSSKILGI